MQYKEWGCFLFQLWCNIKSLYKELRDLRIFIHNLHISTIAGNPGVPEYYLQFMHTLWKKSGEKIPVWCVGHAGHVTGPKHSALGWTDIGESGILFFVLPHSTEEMIYSAELVAWNRTRKSFQYKTHWLVETPLQTKLYGPRQEFERTARFALQIRSNCPCYQ